MKRSLMVLFVLINFAGLSYADECVVCHQKFQPNVVKDWELSKHSGNDVGCATCHGDAHTTDAAYEKAELPTPDVCAT